MAPAGAAERQKKYRERLKALKPEKYETAKKKNAERMKQNRKKISDCNDEEKEGLRKSWRDQKNKKPGKEKTSEAKELTSTVKYYRIEGNTSIEKTSEEKVIKSTVKDYKTEGNTPIEKTKEEIVIPSTIKYYKIEGNKSIDKTSVENQKSYNTEGNISIPSLYELAFSKCIPHFQINFEQGTVNAKKRSDENVLPQHYCNLIDGKQIKSNSTEEIEEMRKKWREAKRKNKEKQKEHEDNLETWREYKRKTKEDEENIKQKLMTANTKLEKEKLSLKTELNSLKKKLKKNRQELKRTEKKNQELIHKVKELENYVYLANTTPVVITNDMTPVTKSVNSFLNENLPSISAVDKEKVKRKLLEHNVLINSIKDAYQSARDLESKKKIKSIIVENDKVKQYKLKTKMASYIGLKGKIRHSRKKSIKTLLQHKFKEFYERDDVSRATAGKKEVKVQKQSKNQIRYLLNTLKNLYKKYKSEGGTLSYSTFKKYRPFYVLSPKANSRNTCACIKHENLKFKLESLRSLKIIESQSLDDTLSLVVCDLQSNKCAYGECEVCRNKKIELHFDNALLDDTVSWYEWTVKAHEYTEKNSEVTKTTKKVVKEMKTAPLKMLIDAFTQELEKFKKHAYNICHQYRQYRYCIENLDDNSVLFHIDFSENYGCKLTTEVQSMHFGASRQQITLHTGVMYRKGIKPLTFCTLSGSNYHGPEGIWAHMRPVLQYLKNECPNITKAHFFSDGPTTQYRQKKNFHLFSLNMKQFGFNMSTWNFFEASHGKGAADGVGGAVKRKLDSFVNCGVDVVDAEMAYQLLQKSDTTVKVFLIPEDTIEMLAIELATIPGTMMIHQVINSNDEELLYRSLSCFCYFKSSESKYCQCYALKKMSLQKPEQKKTKESTKSVTLLNIQNTERKKRHDVKKNTIKKNTLSKSDIRQDHDKERDIHMLDRRIEDVALEPDNEILILDENTGEWTKSSIKRKQATENIQNVMQNYSTNGNYEEIEMELLDDTIEKITDSDQENEMLDEKTGEVIKQECKSKLTTVQTLNVLSIKHINIRLRSSAQDYTAQSSEQTSDVSDFGKISKHDKQTPTNPCGNETSNQEISAKRSQLTIISNVKLTPGVIMKFEEKLQANQVTTQSALQMKLVPMKKQKEVKRNNLSETDINNIPSTSNEINKKRKRENVDIGGQAEHEKNKKKTKPSKQAVKKNKITYSYIETSSEDSDALSLHDTDNSDYDTFDSFITSCLKEQSDKENMEPDFEIKCNTSDEFKKDDWIVARFATKKSLKHFVGRILYIKDNIPTVKFARRVKNSKRSRGLIFTYPNVEDVCEIKHFDDIIVVLPQPNISRRGQIMFDIELSRYNIQ